MLRRTLYIGRPAYLRAKLSCLNVEWGEEKNVWILNGEEIGLVILDHPQITVTHQAVNLILESKGAILWCNEKHLPVSFLVSEAVHYLRGKRIRLQIESSLPLRKQLWKQVIQAKIRNQAAVLEAIGQPPGRLLHLARRVQSGDPTNVEATAASYYWEKYGETFFKNFRRDPGNLVFPNNFLNYGYALVRGVVARALASAGFLLAYGIHHQNQYNAYALADDLMEPLRAWVDYWVYRYWVESEGNDPWAYCLHSQTKKYLLQIPYLAVRWGQKHFALMEVAEKMALELALCFERKKKKMLMPQFPEVEKLTLILENLR